MAGRLDSDFFVSSWPLRIVTRQQGTTITIELTGEWDLTGSPAARHAFDTALNSDPECVVLDLTALAFMDSTGLRDTVEVAANADRQGVRLVIIVASQAVRKLFELCGLEKVLPVVYAAAGRNTDDSTPAAERPPGISPDLARPSTQPSVTLRR